MHKPTCDVLFKMIYLIILLIIIYQNITHYPDFESLGWDPHPSVMEYACEYVEQCVCLYPPGVVDHEWFSTYVASAQLRNEWNLGYFVWNSIWMWFGTFKTFVVDFYDIWKSWTRGKRKNAIHGWHDINESWCSVTVRAGQGHEFVEDNCAKLQ